MPGAIIVANQPSGAGSGTPGEARNDLWLNQTVNLLVGTGGNSSYAWTLLDKPLGSSSSLATPTASTSSFVPDLIGTYRLQLVTNGGGVGNEQILVFRARYSSTGQLQNRGWAYPAFGEEDTEANYGGNQRGWGEDLEGILEDVRVNFSTGNSFVFDPNAASSGSGTYNTFAGAVTAANERGGYSRIWVEDSAAVTTGSYDLSRIVFVSSIDTFPTITFSGSATLTGLPLGLEGMAFRNAKTTGVLCTLTGDAWSRLKFGNFFQDAAAGGAFIDVNGNYLTIDCDYNSGLGGETGQPLIVSSVSNGSFDLIATNYPSNFGTEVAGGANLAVLVSIMEGMGGQLGVTLVNSFGTLATVPDYTVPSNTTSITDTVGTDQDDYNPSGWAVAHNLFLDLSADVTFTGFAQIDSNVTTKHVVNQSAFTATIKHLDSGSASGNQVRTPEEADLDLGPGQMMILTRDDFLSDWRAYVVGSGAAGGTGVDFVYDSAGTPDGNLYNDFSLLHAVASAIPGMKRVYLRSNLTVGADFPLADGWQFISDNPTITVGVPIPRRILSFVGGSFTTPGGGYVLFDNIDLVGNGGSLYAGDTSFITGFTTFFHFRNCKIRAVSSNAVQMGTGGPAPQGTILFESSTVQGTSASIAGFSGGTARVIIRDSDVSDQFAFNGGSVWIFQHESGSTPEFAATAPWSGGAGAGGYVYVGKQSNKTKVANSVSIAASQNNFAPGAWPITDVYRITATNPSLAFTGFAAPTTLQFGDPSYARDTLIIENVGSNTFSLSHDVTSTAANRVLCPGSVSFAIPANSTAMLVYDYTSLRWRVLGAPVSAAGYGLTNTSGTIALKTAVTSLTDAATVAVDADLGPDYDLLATGAVGATRALGNPTNSVVGKRIRIRFIQDATGGRALTFSGNWVNNGFTTTVAQLPNAVSIIEADARGGTPSWYYTITSLEMANLSFVTVSGSKTLALTDANTVQRTTSASAMNITVPAENTVNFPIGTVIEIMQDAAGQVTVVPFDGTVTVKSRNTELKTAGDGASIFLKKKGSNSWQLTGDKST